MSEAKDPSFLARLAQGLKRSSSRLTERLSALATERKLDDAALAQLEDALIAADLGPGPARAVADRLRRDRFGRDVAEAELRAALAGAIAEILAPAARPLVLDPAHKPFVLLVVGVNGSGKTTTIGKLARLFAAEGRKSVLAAADTFRAAAVEQLQEWGRRAGAVVVAGAAGADAAGVAYAAYERAKAEGADVLIVDTAGRLHNKRDLMAQLGKIERALKKHDASAPHETLLVLDAGIGQNALAQVEAFKEIAKVSGLAVAKLDGTAKGGILVALVQRFGLPVRAIGIGEGADDLRPFEAEAFARALLGLA